MKAIVTPEQIVGLKKLVDTLRERDRGYRVFGSGGEGWGHRYLFRPPLTDHQIAEFERRSGVELPRDYRLFLTLVGDGGAGPFYGVASLAEASQYSNLSTPFAWAAKHCLERKEEFDLWARRPGCLEICHLGCGHYELLIVNGATAGSLWTDIKAATNEISPLNKTFYEWYLDWAEEKLRRLDREPLLDQVVAGMHLDDLVNLLGGEMKTSKGKTLQPDEYYASFREASASFVIDGHGKVKAINRFSL